MGSPLTAYKFFFQRLMDPITLEDLKKAFPKNSRLPKDETLASVLQSDSLPPQTVIEILDTAGKRKREARAKSKALTDVTRELQGAQVISNDELYKTWEKLFQALKYEEFKRMYREKADLRGLIATEVQALGNKEQLIEIEKFGSAQISDKLTDMLTAQALGTVASETRQQKIACDEEQEEFDLLEKCLEAAIKTLVEGPMRAYTNRVNDYLPKEDEFTINTSGIFQPALKRANGLHVALSGSTEARVLGAMAAALSRPGIPSMVILDDRMWDPETLYRTLSALEDCPAQVVIMSTMRPKGKRRAKWTYVSIGEELEYIASETIQDQARDEALHPMG